MITHAPRWRKGSLFGCQFQPLDRNDLARILFLAEALDRNSHQPGRHGGIIGRSGLAVLRALITRFFNKRSGRLDPSLAAIAKAANMARSTVQEALKRLEIAGIVERFRRVYRARVTLICELTGRAFEADRVLQDTNAYRLNVPIPNRATDGLLKPATRRNSSDTGKRSETTNILNPMPDLLAGFHDTALANAIGRLNRAIEARSSSA